MLKAKIKKERKTGAVSVFAHQLKTPLSAIKGYADSLLSGDCGELNSMQKEYISDVLENARKISAFIENLLDAYRAEINQLEINLKKVYLRDILRNILSNLDTWIKASNCDVILNIPEETFPVLADSAQISRVIENIIVNAVTYKEKRGKVEVSIEDKGKNILFKCKDNGIGIGKKDFKNVFSKFYRSEKSLEINSSGAGLGLYIGKAIINSHGGKIWFVKNSGLGMTFYFNLPKTKK